MLLDESSFKAFNSVSFNRFLGRRRCLPCPFFGLNLTSRLGCGEGNGLCFLGVGDLLLLFCILLFLVLFNLGLILEGAEATDRGGLRVRVGLFELLSGLPHNCSAER